MASRRGCDHCPVIGRADGASDKRARPPIRGPRWSDERCCSGGWFLEESTNAGPDLMFSGTVQLWLRHLLALPPFWAPSLCRSAAPGRQAMCSAGAEFRPPSSPRCPMPIHSLARRSLAGPIGFGRPSVRGVGLRLAPRMQGVSAGIGVGETTASKGANPVVFFHRLLLAVMIWTTASETAGLVPPCEGLRGGG